MLIFSLARSVNHKLGKVMKFNVNCYFYSVIKLSLPNIGEFDLFLNQVSRLIKEGSQSQILSQGADKCKEINNSTFIFEKTLNFFFNLFLIFFFLFIIRAHVNFKIEMFQVARVNFDFFAGFFLMLLLVKS